MRPFSQLPKKPILSLCFVLLCFFALGCKFRYISLPTVIEVGEEVEFHFRLETDNSDYVANRLYLSARIPSGWDLVSATFTESTSIPESGQLIPSPDTTYCLQTEGGNDYQTLDLKPFPETEMHPGDSVNIHLTFHITSTLKGPYRTWFHVWGSDSAFSNCSNILMTQWDRDERLLYENGDTIPLSFREFINPPAAIDSLVYVPDHDRLLILRQINKWDLTLVDEIEGTDHPSWGLVHCRNLTGDYDSETRLFLGCQNRTLFFRHNIDEGVPLRLEQRLDLPHESRPNGIRMNSPLGHLVARDGSRRNTLYEVEDFGGIKSVRSIPSSERVLVSPDDAFVYNLDNSNIDIYDIRSDPAVFVQRVSLNDVPPPSIAPTDFAIRPDGLFIFVSGLRGRVAVYSRNLSTGELSYESIITNLDNPQSLGLYLPSNLSISENGTELLVASPRANCLSVFQINPDTGDLTLKEIISDADHNTSGLFNLHKAVFSSNGSHIYATTGDPLTHHGGLSSFARNEEIFSDSFESGDLSRWSATSP